ETYQDGRRRHPHAIQPARLEGDEAQRVDCLIQPDPTVLVGEVAERVTHGEANGAADDSDEYALQHEDAADLRAARAHGHEDCYIPILFHHHHHQHDQNIERGHQLDQADGDDGYRALHAQRVQQLAVALHPRGGGVARAGNLFHGWGDFGGAVQIVHLQLDLVDDVLERKRLLRGFDGNETPVVVDVVEAGFKGAGDAEGTDV